MTALSAVCVQLCHCQGQCRSLQAVNGALSPQLSSSSHPLLQALLPGWGIAVVRVIFRIYPSSLSLRVVHILPHSSPLQTPARCPHGSNFPCRGQITAPSSDTAPGSSTGESCLIPGKEEQRSPRPARGTHSEGGDTSAFISVNGLWLLQQ